MRLSLSTALELALPADLDPSAERKLSRRFEGRLAGIDEAGRGPWSGPVAVAAVILDHQAVPDGLADSKKLTEARREQLYEEILETSHVAVALASPREIDARNIRAATLRAMARAANALPLAPLACLIDGRDVPPDLPCPGQAAIKGDGRLLCIAAASIVAKVTRDRLMTRMDGVFPGYGFAGHKGYGTARHAAALAEIGACPLHRRSFRPVAVALGLRDD
ncbi:ribonuclease HII [Stappia sp. 28M-7]|uniref:ribonuclease HII n=1 Tax=Stappia sp. 28M-7 TaxID=2762596 RepID=UPI00163C08A1|nr:ribonuclease HII [Stappia sp. 28M-7]MBC2858259.1 ribonuclease HII [Stappia sp. 28M-7]